MEEIEGCIWIEGEREGSVGDQSEREMVRGRGSEGVFLLTGCSRDYNSLSMMSLKYV